MQNPFTDARLRERPYNAFALGTLAATAGVFASFLIFRTSPSFPAIFLASIMIGAPIARLLEQEGLGSIKSSIWYRHEKIIWLYTYAFFGMANGYAFWYVVLPDRMVTALFSAQLQHVAVGYFAFSTPLFLSIISNNIGLMMSFFLLSFFRGYGSIFLLSWNASVLGLLWGNAVHSAVLSSLALRNVVLIWPYLIPEVLAYFLAAIAGGLLYFNIEKRRARIDRDAYLFFGIAVVLILIGGVIETVILGVV